MMNPENPDQPQDQAGPLEVDADSYAGYQAWLASQAQAPVADDGINSGYTGDPSTPISPVAFSAPDAPGPSWTAPAAAVGPAVLPSGVSAPPPQITPRAPAPNAPADLQAQFAEFQTWINAGRPGAPVQVDPEPPVELDEHLASLSPEKAALTALKDLVEHLSQTHPVLETRRLIAQVGAAWNQL